MQGLSDLVRHYSIRWDYTRNSLSIPMEVMQDPQMLREVLVEFYKKNQEIRERYIQNGFYEFRYRPRYHSIQFSGDY